MSDGEEGTDEIAEILEKLTSLEDENEKMRTQIENLTARIVTLEANPRQNHGYEEKKEKKPKGSKAKSSKRKTSKQNKSESKSSKHKNSKQKKKEKKLSKEAPSKVKKKTKTDKYQFCGETIYVDVPLPFKHGTPHKSPSSELTLDYAYGYNGGITENLISFDNDEGQLELAYGLAGVGVIHNTVTNAQRHFVGHNEDVTCISSIPGADSKTNLIATGQRDPKDSEDKSQENKPYVCIWDPIDCHEVGRIRNYFEKELQSVAFTCDGKYLFGIGGDDSHTGGLYLVEGLKGEHKVKNFTKPLVHCMTSKAPVFGQSHAPVLIEDAYHWITFGEKTLKWWDYNPETKDFNNCSPQSYSTTKMSQSSYHSVVWAQCDDTNYVIAGCHSGHLYLFNESKELINYKVLSKKPVKCIVVDRTDEKQEKYRAYDSKGESWVVHIEGGKLVINELAPGGLVPLSATITSLGDVYLGAKKGSIVKHNTDEETANETVMVGHSKEIWCLAAHPHEKWLAVGSHDKTLRIWDYETKQNVKTIKNKSGIVTGDFSRDGQLLVVGTVGGSLKVYKAAGDWDCVFEKKMSKEQLSAVAFSGDGSKIIIGGWDQYIHIAQKKGDTFKMKKKVLKGHTSSITHLCLSEDGKFAQSNSKDCEILYWDIAAMEQIYTIENDVIWDRWNCILGWPVQGLFYSAGDPTDVNACEISGGNELDDDNGRKMIASGDDSGMVSVFKYPILEAKPQNVDTYYGHSAHVTNVRWAEDDSYLFTTGGGDLSVFQWKVSPK